MARMRFVVHSHCLRLLAGSRSSYRDQATKAGEVCQSGKSCRAFTGQWTAGIFIAWHGTGVHAGANVNARRLRVYSRVG